MYTSQLLSVVHGQAYKRATVPPQTERKPKAKGVVSPSCTDTLMLETDVVIITGASR